MSQRPPRVTQKHRSTSGCCMSRGAACSRTMPALICGTTLQQPRRASSRSSRYGRTPHDSRAGCRRAATLATVSDTSVQGLLRKVRRTETENKISDDILELVNKHGLTSHQSMNLLKRLGRLIEMRQRVA